MKTLFVFFFSLCLVQGLFGQSLENIVAKQERKTLVITYELKGQGTFEVSISPSYKGKMTALTGDTGTQTEGTKKITWDVLKDREELDTEIFFEVRAKHTVDDEEIKDEDLEVFEENGVLGIK